MGGGRGQEEGHKQVPLEIAQRDQLKRCIASQCIINTVQIGSCISFTISDATGIQQSGRLTDTVRSYISDIQLI